MQASHLRYMLLVQSFVLIKVYKKSKKKFINLEKALRKKKLILKTDHIFNINLAFIFVYNLQLI